MLQNVEIERKFIVNKQEFLNTSPPTPSHIQQYYWHPENAPTSFGLALDYLVLNQEIYDRPVLQECATLSEGGVERYEMRVREKDQQYFLTFKSKDRLPLGGVEEYEYAINKILGRTLINSSDLSIEKHRYDIPWKEWLIEVDVFSDLDLVIAEIEIPSLDVSLGPLPSWIGEEVTDKKEYGNRTLAQRCPVRPYKI